MPIIPFPYLVPADSCGDSGELPMWARLVLGVAFIMLGILLEKMTMDELNDRIFGSLTFAFVYGVMGAIMLALGIAVILG